MTMNLEDSYMIYVFIAIGTIIATIVLIIAIVSSMAEEPETNEIPAAILTNKYACMSQNIRRDSYGDAGMSAPDNSTAVSQCNAWVSWCGNNGGCTAEIF